MEKDNLPKIDGLFPICPGKISIPTEKETEALEALRSIKGVVRRLKADLRELRASGHGVDSKAACEITQELARLKADWEQWETKRQQAAKARMILLGHEEVL